MRGTCNRGGVSYHGLDGAGRAGDLNASTARSGIVPDSAREGSSVDTGGESVSGEHAVSTGEVTTVKGGGAGLGRATEILGSAGIRVGPGASLGDGAGAGGGGSHRDDESGLGGSVRDNGAVLLIGRRLFDGGLGDDGLGDSGGAHNDGAVVVVGDLDGSRLSADWDLDGLRRVRVSNLASSAHDSRSGEKNGEEELHDDQL